MSTSTPRQWKTPIATIVIISVIGLAVNIIVFMLIERLVSQPLLLAQNLVQLNPINFIDFEERPEPPPPLAVAANTPVPEMPKPPVTDNSIKIDSKTAVTIDIPTPDIVLPAWPRNPDLSQVIANNADLLEPEPRGNNIDLAPVATIQIEPYYPQRALRRRIEGEVTIEFTINVDGTVSDVTIIAAKPANIFNDAVLKAALKSRFEPDRVAGKAVPKRAQQTVKFKLK